MADLTKMRIVLLGRTGHGKSSSGNTILGDSTHEKFVINCSPNSVTSGCEALTGLRSGNETRIEIIDTPGFFDTHMSDEKLKLEIVKCITLSSPGPHAFIIVLRVGTFTKQEVQTVAEITKSFGECAFKYSAVLFTDGDRLDDNQTIEQFVEQNKELKELVEKCGGRCHVIDNKRWNQEQHNYRSNRVQVEKLLNTIEEMVRQNGGGCYTNEMLKAVEEAIQREEEEVRNENPKEKSAFKIRAEATGRFMKKFFAKSAGLAAGVLVGALLGIGSAVAAVIAVIVRGAVIIAVTGTTGATIGLCVAGGIVAGAGVVGAIRGGIVGFQAVEDGDGVCEAAKKAATANWENTKMVVAEAKELVSELKEVIKTTTSNKD